MISGEDGANGGVVATKSFLLSSPAIVLGVIGREDP